MNSQALVDQLSTEVFFFNLMGKVLQTSPSRENLAWFQLLASERIFDDVLFGTTQSDISMGASQASSWLQNNLQAGSVAQYDILNIDHTRLLVGPGSPLAPPWESFYFNSQGLLFQEQTTQVREWFRRFGLESEKIHQEPDDHIGLESSFLGHLAARALSSVERSEPEETKRIIDAQHDFLVQHPFRWVPRWCSLMLEHARTDFYAGVALLIRGSLKELALIHQIEFPAME